MGVTTQWSATDIVNATVSNGGLTLTNSGTNGGAARGANPMVAGSGVWYFEGKATFGWSSNMGIGLADPAVAIAALSPPGAGSVTANLGAIPKGQIQANGTQLVNCNYPNDTDTVAVCADLARLLAYFRDCSVDPVYGWNSLPTWNGSGSASPAGNAGGLSTTAAWGASGVTVYAAMAFVTASAQLQQVTFYGSYASFFGPVPSGFTPLGGTWNPVGADPNLRLSNGNLTAQVAAGASLTTPSILGTVAMVSGGKYYFEIGWDFYGGSDSNGISVCNAGYANQIVMVPDGRIYNTSGQLGQVGSQLYLNGLRVGVAVDLVNNRIWFRILGANPVTGQGGIPIGPVSASGKWAPLGVVYGTSDALNAAFAQTGFVGTVPSNAQPWPGTFVPDTLVPPGAGWSVLAEPVFSTRSARAMTGRRWRSPQQQYPTTRFTLTFEGLTSLAAFQGLPPLSLQYLKGFFIDHQGSFGEFLFQDTFTPDYQVASGLLGYGDGSTTVFPFARALRNTYEPVGWVNAGDVSQVTVAGVTQSSGWTVTAPNLLTFATAPAAGATIAASFNFFWRCTFSDDTASFEEFMAQLFELKELKLETLPSAVASPLP